MDISSQVRDLIQRYRTLTHETLKDKNKELDESREALHKMDAEHTKTVQQWDLEKENIKNTISAIVAQVMSKRDELGRIERETEELRLKVDERRKRNEEHLAVLRKRKEIVVQQAKEQEQKDAVVRDRFRAFERSRDESREQLTTAVKKVEESSPREEEAHQQKLRQLRSKVAEMGASIEAEAKSWALERAMREWNEKSESRKAITEEVAAAETGKDTWAQILQESNGLQSSDSIKSILELRSILAA